MNTWSDPIGWWKARERPFRRMPRKAAVAVLFLLGVVLVWAAFAPSMSGGAFEAPPADQIQPAEDAGDLALYKRISERVVAGDNYYAAAMDEQRMGNYPTRPFVTVRLPTLAVLHGTAGAQAMGIALKIALPIAIVLFMAKLRNQVRPPESVGAGIAMLFGGAGVIVPEAYLIHEVVAGIFLSLAFAAYRPYRWWPALIFAAIALSIREIAAPFVLLWLAFALVERRWKEVAGITIVLTLFFIGMYFHYLGVEAHRLPGDMPSQGWDASAGPALPLAALSRLTVLLFLPLWLAAPLAFLPLIGWFGVGGRVGLFAGLWFLGFFTAISLFARPENFYWAQLTLPIYLAGIAFAPRAIADLLAAARDRKQTQS